MQPTNALAYLLLLPSFCVAVVHHPGAKWGACCDNEISACQKTQYQLCIRHEIKPRNVHYGVNEDDLCPDVCTPNSGHKIQDKV
ncbi:hypothetical protein Ptr902_07424 [Pyrenophora tritici-repentis]|nr:hypothetical protein Ptr902_07424 [Pyrenophora tritici-repentis]